jgi:hypothetical protein
LDERAKPSFPGAQGFIYQNIDAPGTLIVAEAPAENQASDTKSFKNQEEAASSWEQPLKVQNPARKRLRA